MQWHRSIVVCVALAALAIVSGCQRAAEQAPAGRADPRAVQTLAPVQVERYQGKDLSSIEDFRENSIKGPQRVDLGSYRLTVKGGSRFPAREFTYDEVTALPPVKKVVTLNCVEGWSVDILWEGVRLADILTAAGWSPASSVGPAPKVLIFRCADGYSTSLPLDYVIGRDILLAYKMNGVELPTERGFPFQVVAEDKWGYKWAKWVTEIELSDDTSFRGYWEQRGYDDGADLPSAR